MSLSLIPQKNTDRYNNLREELRRVLIAYTTPEIKFFGVSEIYEINYILNNYGLMFKRSLYRLFITVAIMDSIGTRLGTKMSYIIHSDLKSWLPVRVVNMAMVSNYSSETMNVIDCL
jgi:hypothetical protein